MKLVDIHAALLAPFKESEVEWRAQRTGIGNNGPWCMALAYITNRAIMNRFDEIFGPLGWQNDFKPVANGFICGIGVHDIELGQWVWKWDGAQETDIEATKGGLSGAMKRAAVQWGPGRYLYDLETTFAECSTERPSRTEKHLWHQAKANGTTFYWKNPELPKWALPE